MKIGKVPVSVKIRRVHLIGKKYGHFNFNGQRMAWLRLSPHHNLYIEWGRSYLEFTPNKKRRK